jgi:hypothetical protein
MSVNERSFTTSSASNNQGTGGSSPVTSGGPNPSDEQTEPTSALSIFALDYKK